MDNFKNALVVLFKEQNPYKILNGHYSLISEKKNSHLNINKKIFVGLYENLERQCSQDEVENLYDIIVKNTNKEFSDLQFDNSVFNLLIKYTDKMFENQGDNVKCKYKDLLKWRMTSLKLDADMFICSYLAYKDILIGRKRKYYDWETIIKSNNKRLHNMLSKGLSENHFHLKGSAPTFKLSWVSLMNDISCRETEDIKIDSNEGRLAKDFNSEIDLKSAIVVAAVIRIILFKTLLDKKESSVKYNTTYLENILKEIINDDGRYAKEVISLYAGEIQREINALRYCVGDTIKYNGNDIHADYAITKDIDTKDHSIRLFVGERAFMYKCFKEFYGDNREFFKKANLFYAYLIIKNKVRGELIQQNESIGFSNFSNYQERKTKYLKKDTVFYDSVEPGAVLTSIKSQNINSLELRVIPGFLPEDNIAEIERMDKLILSQVYNDKNNTWLNKKNISSEGKKILETLTSSEVQMYLNNMDIKTIKDVKDKFFYVYHFPKKADKLESCKKDDLIFASKCRHYELRESARKYGTSIYKMREQNQECAKRVLGIDTCSFEIKARPEVYGQVFRFLKGHIPSVNTNREYKNIKSLPRLRATFHVGEDFLDCIDGLRAIDEAILFCGLTHGDRLGHAIALGIDVRNWYERKNNKVYLSKHDILDNIAWLIMKLKYYDITNSSVTIDKLMEIYNKYYAEIYISDELEDISDDKLRKHSGYNIVPVDTYMEAWKIRGDDPKIYNNYEKKSIQEITYWDRCSKLNRNTKKSRTVRELYQRYHYDTAVKFIGYQKEVFKVKPYIIDAIEEVQKMMQDYVREMGIAIECNPSSNVLISTFERYDKHPIINMYNLGLTIDDDNADKHPQLFVSINTDDQGVFDTLLENEFALMAIALEKAKDYNGKPLYNQSMIYDWLDRVREMGIEQSFNNFEVN